jgi:N-acetyl-anhydromuramyl-L-alanine amidase AmpD
MDKDNTYITWIENNLRWVRLFGKNLESYGYDIMTGKLKKKIKNISIGFNRLLYIDEPKSTFRQQIRDYRINKILDDI